MKFMLHKLNNSQIEKATVANKNQATRYLVIARNFTFAAVVMFVSYISANPVPIIFPMALILAALVFATIALFKSRSV